jgi:hypothetical protein
VSPMKYELGFYIPEDDILHSHRRETLKSYIDNNCQSMLLYTIFYHPDTKYSELVCISFHRRNMYVSDTAEFDFRAVSCYYAHILLIISINNYLFTMSTPCVSYFIIVACFYVGSMAACFEIHVI